MKLINSKTLWILYVAFVVIATIVGAIHYPGKLIIYLFFTLVFNLLLVFAFIKHGTFFDLYLGIFFYLGFWLKLTLRITIADGYFHDAVGLFDRTAQSFDRALFVASVGGAGFVVARLLRTIFYQNLFLKPGVSLNSLKDLYSKKKIYIIVLFTITFLMIAFLNAQLGVYQRGMVSKTALPFGLKGIFTWLIFFGFTSFSTFIIFFDIQLNKKITWGFIIALLEIMFSNISMLSRGFVLNSSSLVAGFVKTTHFAFMLKHKKSIFILILSLISFFIISVYSVNLIRSAYYHIEENFMAKDKSLSQSNTDYANKNFKFLFIDRWVGMEGVLAISSHKNLGWPLFKEALSENYVDYGTSFYDKTVVTNSTYIGRDLKDNHFINIPGVIAFFYYSGSLWIVFIATLLFGTFANILEFLTLYFSGQNLFFSSLIGQVVAYRYIHFGYVPKQSYLLFGTILFNIFIFYFLDKILKQWKIWKEA